MLYKWPSFDEKSEEMYFLYTNNADISVHKFIYFFCKKYLEKFLQFNIEFPQDFFS